MPAITLAKSPPSATIVLPDPIFEAIDAHRTAHAAFEAAVSLCSKLEQELPHEKRQWEAIDENEPIPATDDPRWIDARRAYNATFDAAGAAAIALINLHPTTIAGVAALLRYAHDFAARGNEWPSRVLPEGEPDDSPNAQNWAVFLHESLAEALEKISAGGRNA